MRRARRPRAREPEPLKGVAPERRKPRELEAEVLAGAGAEQVVASVEDPHSLPKQEPRT